MKILGNFRHKIKIHFRIGENSIYSMYFFYIFINSLLRAALENIHETNDFAEIHKFIKLGQI